MMTFGCMKYVNVYGVFQLSALMAATTNSTSMPKESASEMSLHSS